MKFANIHLDTLISNFKDFSIEGFNIFAKGKDNLPHLICACPNKDTARAIKALLTIAKKAWTLHVANAYITSNCHLSPRILADGTLGMVAIVINDAVYMDGNDLEYNEPNPQLGTSEYEEFLSRFLDVQEKEGES